MLEQLRIVKKKDLDRLYQVNIKGVFNCSKAVIPFMKKEQSGVVINMASIASSVGISDRFAYSMTKGAVLTMTLFYR
jgi:2-keto-3-deoxy-L-fuconate dehydrogenase